MSLDDARREARCIYVCGAPGQLISSLVWFLSAALGTWVSWRAAMWALVAGGIFIFVALEAFIRLIGRRPSLSPGNPLNPLVMQIAFTLPFMLPLIVAAFRGQPDWLYPAFLVALGAHFLPFMFFFGLWHFGVIAMLLAGCGIVFGVVTTEAWQVAGWVGAVLQAVFAALLYSVYRQERGGRNTEEKT
ncbi:MAG TPA: hypothetical protein VKZ99_04725 [Gammaproteobacteria bacterium]|nr:hypothetical protein [Gammaproteobacteria bacterium]